MNTCSTHSTSWKISCGINWMYTWIYALDPIANGFLHYKIFLMIRPLPYGKAIRHYDCRNPSLGLATKARGLQGCGRRGRPGSHLTCSQECEKCEGMNPHTLPSELPLWELESQMDSQILWIQGCSWLVLAPKVFKICTNQLVVWF
jgi:hypothetical protein